MSQFMKYVPFTFIFALIVIVFGYMIHESPYTPHSYNKIDRDEYLLDSFSTMDKWTLDGGEESDALTVTSFTNDTASIKLTASNAPTTITSSTQVDLGKYTGGELSFYVENKENIEYVLIIFATDSTLSGPFGYVTFEEYQLVNGWNTLPFSTTQIASENGFTPNTDINTLQILLQPKNGKASIFLDTIKMIHADKANVIFIMDDGWESQYSTGFKILSTYKIPGNIAVVPSLVDQDNYMSHRELNKLYSHDWDFLNHTFSHPDLSSLTLEEQRQEITDCMNWLNDKGFTRASDAVVYPYSGYNENTFEVLSEIGSQFGRTVDEGIETHFVNEDYQAKVINLISDYKVDYAKQQIDTAIATGNTVFFLNHKFGDESDPMYFSKEKFESIAKYVNTKVAAGQIQTPTVSEWLEIQ